jgi:hypothetical protein
MKTCHHSKPPLRYRYCKLLKAILDDPQLAGMKILHYTSTDPRKRANAAYLMSCFLVMMCRKSAGSSDSAGSTTVRRSLEEKDAIDTISRFILYEEIVLRFIIQPYKFCTEILENAVVFSELTNVFMIAFCICKCIEYEKKKSPQVNGDVGLAYRPFANIRPAFMPYRDATCSPVCAYQCTILDCVKGLE